jgi:3-oxoadipate enol-lactonase
MPEISQIENGNSVSTTLFFLDPQPNGGPGMLLLHGLGANSSSWQLQMPVLLAAGFRPIAPDLPGFGQSHSNQGRWSIRNTARAVAVALEQLHVAPLHVVGISMGGTVALQLALDYPEMVKKLVLVSTFARLWPESLGGWLYFAQRAFLVWGRGMGAQAEYVAARIFPGEGQQELRLALFEQIMQANPDVYKQAMLSLGLFNVLGRLKTIQAQTLVVTGENDTTVPVHNQRPLVERIPGAIQVKLANAGHALCVEQPELFNKYLIDFLC